MLIICEGVDNGGKTTLIQALARLHNDPKNLVIRHQGPPPDGANLVEHYERELLTDLLPQIRSTTTLVLLDRHHVGELIYGPVYRGGSRLSPGAAMHVDLLLQALGGIRVLVQPNRLDEVRRRYEVLGDGLLQPEHLGQVYTSYEVYAARHGWIRGAAFPEDHSLGPDDILRVAEATTLVTQFSADVPGYVGSHWPRVVLVGERRSTGPGAIPAPWTTAAFTPLHESSSAAWLMRALLAVADTSQTGLLNAYEPGVDLKVAWGLLRRPHLVALGNAASRALSEAGLDHLKVVHPQYARRFMHRDPDAYTQTLKRAITGAPDLSRLR